MFSDDKLKALQVKAELSKLPDAPRAYFEKLVLDNKMEDDPFLAQNLRNKEGNTFKFNYLSYRRHKYKYNREV